MLFALSPPTRTQPSALHYFTSFANTTKGVLPFFTFPRSSSSSSRISWMKPCSSSNQEADYAVIFNDVYLLGSPSDDVTVSYAPHESCL
jgi:hypothetical protein